MWSKTRSSVYAIRCEKNGKVYIGISKDPETRLQFHLIELKGGRKRLKNPEWQKDFDEFGMDSFKAYILETDVAWDDRRDREHHWIKAYRAADPRFGYNKDKMEQSERFSMASGRPPMMKENEI